MIISMNSTELKGSIIICGLPLNPGLRNIGNRYDYTQSTEDWEWLDPDDEKVLSCVYDPEGKVLEWRTYTHFYNAFRKESYDYANDNTNKLKLPTPKRCRTLKIQ